MTKITETELLKRGFVYNDSLDSYDLLYIDMDNNSVGDRITLKKKGPTKKWEATFYRRDLQTHNEEVVNTRYKTSDKNYEFQYRGVRRVVAIPFLLWLGFEANPPKLEWKSDFGIKITITLKYIGVYSCTLEEFGVEVIKDFQIRTFYDLKHFFSSAHLFDIFKTMK